MKYYYGRILEDISFDEAVKKVIVKLSEEGFGVLTTIDVKEIFRKKLEVDFRNYKILGACNPAFAYKALQEEDKIGVMLPCNVVVQEKTPGVVEIAVVDPVVSMQGIENVSLSVIAGEVRSKLRKVVDKL
ncbi:DUF302 domain-containing protein [Sinomicrobium weinanense]|uniref:DUF302 domain-containing protein n=1 Tax=Sinomicrobium weinanense TaxID=2842200 RepID=A0A926Q1N1_9FLAO|nr:DUF302 domain-containing protein [Sinomicrobium weinanense]MBC9795773.1 DUF302 domain-containing protein [Sinomicrobium weinanense]MBU3121817.1 DUF302 domain-containing protein [Sinomicrobium weinanense]